MKTSFVPMLALGGLLVGGLAQAQSKGDAAKGKEVFQQCGVCHNADSDVKKMGPGLKGLYKKPALKNGKKPSDATVLGVVNKGGNGMPSYEELLSAAEKTDLLAYLKTL
jgi:cytochrome c